MFIVHALMKPELLFLQAYWNLSWALVDECTLVVIGSNSKMSNSHSENHVSDLF